MSAATNATGAPRRFVSNSTESVRMFRHDWMEALSKIHWSAPLIVYLPITAWLLRTAMVRDGDTPVAIAGWLLAGLACWTLSEYVLHRFVFHFVPKNAIGQRLHFIFHGVHHDYPSDRLRLVMPPSASLPISLAFYGLFSLALAPPALHPFMAGFLIGYMVYDTLHYALHHATFRQPLLKALKRHHMQHHFVDPDRGYGVSSPLWDHLLGTRALPAPEAKAAVRAAR
jgi:sterol desaturase/sphingolipid hydroxylase (fatty acid hydroxylase superfamily)